jgi:hypothetical protein
MAYYETTTSVEGVIKMETTTEKTSLLSKKQDEITVGDSLKIVTGAALISAAVPLVIYGVVAGVTTVHDKFKARKLAKETVEILNEDAK